MKVEQKRSLNHVQKIHNLDSLIAKDCCLQENDQFIHSGLYAAVVAMCVLQNYLVHNLWSEIRGFSSVVPNKA